MSNPLLSLQMAWADDKLTNSFWYVIHDLFSFSGNTFFLKEKKNPNPFKFKKKMGVGVCVCVKPLLQNNLESKNV